VRVFLIYNFLLLFFVFSATAQWTNRYPKVAGHGHHIYLEAFELPIMNGGPMDPAPSPDHRSLAFSAKGWLWLLDLQTMAARRITNTGSMDSRPEWSKDGSQLLFIRDTGSDTQIVLLDLLTNNETMLVDEPAIDLDPSFSPDSRKIYYASAASGMIDLWSLDLDTNEKIQITDNEDGATKVGGIQLQKVVGEGYAGIQRRPLKVPGEPKLVYLNKVGHFYNTIAIRDLTANTDQILVEDPAASQSDFDVSSDGSLMAYTWPYNGGYEIRLMSLNRPGASLRLTASQKLPLAPAFSADDQWVYFSEAGSNERMELKRISTNGGSPELLKVSSWDWGTPTGSIKVITRVDGEERPVRLNVVDHMGHPVIPDTGAVRFEGQNGRIFYYSNGEIALEAPAGEVTITAVQGFSTRPVEVSTQVMPGERREVVVELERIWKPNASGWYSGDNHFHLNYGGTYQLDPEDIALDMKGEALDVAYPLLANLYFRFLQQELWGWQNSDQPLIRFGQEVRSHFLGHISLLGGKNLFWPWIWGPLFDIYNTDDRTNAIAIQQARDEGGVGGYVHPVSSRTPFADGNLNSVPTSLIADGVMGSTDILEVACLWSEELGTSAVWHELLNIGIPLAASAGSDVMTDYYRTMAVGSTRVFVKPDGPLTESSYLNALKSGRSFVSNGPMLEFLADDQGPGETIGLGSKSIGWSLTTHSALPYDTVEIIVNGKVVWSKAAKTKSGTQKFKGRLEVPAGGWVSARVYGGSVEWPFMDSYPYAETSPVWFGSIGSTDPEVAKLAAQKLLKLLYAARERLIEGYGGNPIPNLLQQFDQAEGRLKEFVDQ
jgi:TolB protein